MVQNNAIADRVGKKSEEISVIEAKCLCGFWSELSVGGDGCAGWTCDFLKTF